MKKIDILYSCLIYIFCFHIIFSINLYAMQKEEATEEEKKPLLVGGPILTTLSPSLNLSYSTFDEETGNQNQQSQTSYFSSPLSLNPHDLIFDEEAGNQASGSSLLSSSQPDRLKNLQERREQTIKTLMQQTFELNFLNEMPELQSIDVRISNFLNKDKYQDKIKHLHEQTRLKNSWRCRYHWTWVLSASIDVLAGLVVVGLSIEDFIDGDTEPFVKHIEGVEIGAGLLIAIGHLPSFYSKRMLEKCEKKEKEYLKEKEKWKKIFIDKHMCFTDKEYEVNESIDNYINPLESLESKTMTQTLKDYFMTKYQAFFYRD